MIFKLACLMVFLMLAFAVREPLAARAGTVALQVVGGHAVSLGIGLSIWQIGRSMENGDTELALAFFAPPAVILSSSAVVYWIGDARDDPDGSYWWTLLGASTPVVAGILIGAVVNQTSPDGFPPAIFGALVGYMVGALGSPAGAVLGYHLSIPKITAQGGLVQFVGAF